MCFFFFVCVYEFAILPLSLVRNGRVFAAVVRRNAVMGRSTPVPELLKVECDLFFFFF